MTNYTYLLFMLINKHIQYMQIAMDYVGHIHSA